MFTDSLCLHSSTIKTTKRITKHKQEKRTYGEKATIEILCSYHQKKANSYFKGTAYHSNKERNQTKAPEAAVAVRAQAGGAPPTHCCSQAWRVGVTDPSHSREAK